MKSQSRGIRWIATVLMGLTLTQAIASKPAHAIVAAVTGGTAIPALVVLGAGLIGAPVSLAVGLPAAFCVENCSPTTEAVANWTLLASLGAILTGVVLLDANEAGAPAYQELASADAEKLGVTDDQRSAFNSELPEINAISQSVAAEVARTRTSDLSQVRGIWARYLDAGQISEESRQALGRISSQLAQRLGN